MTRPLRKPLAPQLRALLRKQFPDGERASVLAVTVGLPDTPASHDVVTRALKAMPDTYRDRWLESDKAPPAAIWCAVHVPEDCPKPTPKRSRT